MNNQCYFWRNTNQVLPKFEQYLEKINQLCSGDHAGLDIEKLQGADGLYCLRLDREARLIYTLLNHQVCLLELLEHHEYHQSRFLRNPALKDHVLQALARTQIKAPAAEAIAHAPAKAIPLELHQQQFITFNEQQEAMFHQSLPLLVSGPAGSGKTCMAMSMITDFIAKNADEAGDKRIVYITKSALLAHQLKGHWEMTKPELKANFTVDFIPYGQLLPQDKVVIEAEDQHFTQWFQKHEAKLSLNAHQTWQEFRMISGLSNQEAYLALGKKQSQLQNLEDKNTCYALYESYQKLLQASNLCSPSLQRLTCEPCFDLVVVDEAQDLSFAQLANLDSLVKQSNIVYFLGDHQLLFDVKSKLNFIKSIYHQKATELSTLLLSQSYRCPVQVIDVANTMIQTKYQVTGGLADSIETPQICMAPQYQDKPGDVCWIEPKNKALQKDIRPHAQNHYFAVIVLDEAYRAEACELFQCEPARVFTPESIKGLEFKMVVVWKPLSTPEAQEVNKCLAAIDLDSVDDEKSAVHRPKAGQANEDHLHFFNRLITAVTRCQQSLIWVEIAQHRSIQLLINKLKRGFMAPQLKAAPIAPSKQQDWEQLVLQYFYNDNTDGAQAIFNLHLKEFYPSFQHFCIKHKLPIEAAPLAEVAVAAKAQVAADSKSMISQSAVKDFIFEHPYFKSSGKREDWAHKQDIVKLTESPNLAHDLAVFFNKFKTKGGLDNVLIKDKCIKTADAKRKNTHVALLEWLLSDKHRTINMIQALASHTQVLMKLSISHLQSLVGKEHSFYPAFVQLAEVQEVIFQALYQGEILPEEVLNPAINLPVIHTLYRLDKLDLMGNLISVGAPIAATNHKGNSLLHAAVLNRDLKNIQFLKSIGFHLYTLNRHKKTVAYVAAGYGDIEVYNLLSDCGVDWHSPEDDGSYPIQHAIERANNEVALQMITNRYRKKDFFDSLGLYQRALRSPEPVNTMTRLLTIGLDPHQPDSQKLTPIELIMKEDFSDGTRLSLIKLIHKTGFPLLDFRVENSKHLVHLAAKYNRCELLELLEQHFDLEPLFITASKSQMLPIEEAIQHGAIDTLQYLIEKGPKGGFSPEHHEKFAVRAVISNQAVILSKLYESGVKLSDVRVNGETLAHIAVRFSHPHLIHQLSPWGVNLLAPNESGEIPFLLAAKMGCKKSFAEMTAIQGMPLNATDIQGNNACHLAAMHDHFELLSMMKKDRRFETLITKTNTLGLSPLLMAIKTGKLRSAEYLLGLGFKVEHALDKDKNILYLALQCNDIKMLALLGQNKIDLFEAVSGQSLIHHAIIENKLEAFKYLIQKNRHFNELSDTGLSPLFMIASSGKHDFLQYLKEVGHKFDAKNKSGENVLHVLMKSGLPAHDIQLFLVKLYDLKIDVQSLLMNMDKNTVAPLFYLVQREEIALIKFIEEHFKILWQDEKKGFGIQYLDYAIRNGRTELIKLFFELFSKTGPSDRVQSIFYHSSFFTVAVHELIFVAIKHGQLASLKQIHELGESLKIYDYQSFRTTVEQAIICHDLDILKYLVLENGYVHTIQYLSIAHCAASRNASEILEWIASQEKLKEYFQERYPSGKQTAQPATVAMAAAECGALEALQTLDRLGVDLKQSIEGEYDALWSSITPNQFYPEVIEFLISRGFDINKAYGKNQETLLMKSIKVNLPDALPFLVEHGARLDWMDADTGENLFLYAVQFGGTKYLERLMQFGLDINHRTPCQHNALHIAAKRGDVEVINWMLNLIAFSPMLIQQDKFCNTPHGIAKMEHDLEVMAILEKAEAEAETKNKAQSGLNFFNVYLEASSAGTAHKPG